jgi:hypothetical protein
VTDQLELWGPGWDIEPCDTAAPDPDEQAFLDLHGPPPRTPRPYRNVTTHHHPEICCDRDRPH